MIAADSNVLAYAEGIDDEARQARAIFVVEAIGENLIIPVQALGELFNVLVRKGGHSTATARARVEVWADTCPIIPTLPSMLADATTLVAAHSFQIWDAIILCAAAEAGCSLLLSEDMQHGFVWSSVTIVNPFAEPEHPLLAAALTA